MKARDWGAATFTPIGFVEHAVPDDAVRFQRRHLVASIYILPQWAPALEGIEAFSHLFVLFWLHRMKGTPGELRIHPRGRSDLPRVGLFATRTPRRPNPIGLAVVELLERQGAKLVVQGLDAYNGTPVLDLKPYDPWDRVENPRVPAWWKRLASASP